MIPTGIREHPITRGSAPLVRMISAGSPLMAVLSNRRELSGGGKLSSILAVFLLIVRERRISPGLILIAQLALPTLGFAILQANNGEVRDGWLVLAAPLIIAVGMALGRSPRETSELASSNPVFAQFLKHAFWILSTLAVLHFALGGIPVFSASIETDRFNLGSSGLGGFPSRAVLYGIPVVALLSLATVSEATKRQTVAIWTLYICTQLALGFKGSALEIIVMAAIAYTIRVGTPQLKHLALFGLCLVIAFVYVEVVRSLYATTSVSDTRGFEYILDRVTTEAIESGYLALWHSPDFSGGLSAFWHDLQQLIARYLGRSDAGDFTFDMLMSSIVTGTPLGVGMFIVPVTVGGTVYLMFSLATPLVVAVLAAIGFAYSWAVASLRGKPSILRSIFAAVLLVGLRIFVLNGNGAYLTINLSFAFFLLWLCALPSLYMNRPHRLGDFKPEQADHVPRRPVSG